MSLSNFLNQCKNEGIEIQVIKRFGTRNITGILTRVLNGTAYVLNHATGVMEATKVDVSAEEPAYGVWCLTKPQYERYRAFEGYTSFDNLLLSNARPIERLCLVAEHLKRELVVQCLHDGELIRGTIIGHQKDYADVMLADGTVLKNAPIMQWNEQLSGWHLPKDCPIVDETNKRVVEALLTRYQPQLDNVKALGIAHTQLYIPNQPFAMVTDSSDVLAVNLDPEGACEIFYIINADGSTRIECIRNTSWPWSAY
jgi:hypothetical protein